MDREYYRRLAQQCFDMAIMARDPVVVARWIARANEYMILAAHPFPTNEGGHRQGQQQRQQQQQERAKDDRDET